MNNSELIRTAGFVAAGLLAGTQVFAQNSTKNQANSPKKPNIIFILGNVIKEGKRST